MMILILGLAIFFAVHSISIVNDNWRQQMITKIGAGGWRGLYSLGSLLGFALMVWGYGLARQQPLLVYMPNLWLHRLALVALLPVFPLLLATYLPGRIQQHVKHPMLLAIKLWASAHLLANGMLADILLFGSFLVWAIACRISVKRRTPRPSPGAARRPINDLIAIALGLVLYVVFARWLHAWLIGVAPTFI